MTAYLSALAVCAMSIAVGGALCCRSGWSWIAAPVGLGAVLLLALAAVRLPGHGTTAAVVLAVATGAGAVVTARRRVPLTALADGAPVALAVLVGCSLPFAASDRIGELGAWINNDLAVHMAQADELRTLGSDAHITVSGYPNGPHAVVAALDAGLGVGPSAGFTGLLIAVPVLTALAALAALEGTRWFLRLPAAALTGVPFLAASYFAQGSFKEPLLGLLFLGTVLALREAYRLHELGPRLVVSIALMAAAGVAVFGIAALAWPAAALLWLGALEYAHGRRPRFGIRLGRRGLAALAGVAVVALGVALALGASDFFESGPGRYLTTKGTGGNFGGQISPVEAAGVWRNPDFRAGSANPLDEPGILLACAVLAFGLYWCWRRRDWALLAGALGAISIYVVARPFTLAYFSGKALTVAAPLLTLVAVSSLAGIASSGRLSLSRPIAVRPWAAAATLAAYVLVAGASSALALRGAHVRPPERGHDLAAFRPLVSGEPTIYLGRDNYAPWELRGAGLLGFQSYDTPVALGIPELPRKYTGDAEPPAVDTDSIPPHLLAGARYLVAPRTAYASRPPPNFRPIRWTRWHVLWERRGRTLPRSSLAEGEAPGKILRCGTALSRRQGVAYLRPPPVVGRSVAWRGGRSVDSGGFREQELTLSPGRWDISLRYFSDVPLRLRAGSIDVTLPPYLSDESTFASAGRVTSPGGPLRVRVDVAPRRRIGIVRTVRLGTLVATRTDDVGRLVPLSRACGRYVDWYRVEPQARG